MSKKLFLAVVVLLCMSAPSMASWSLVDWQCLKSIDDSLIKLTEKISELVEVEKEQNKILKRSEKELEYIAEN